MSLRAWALGRLDRVRDLIAGGVTTSMLAGTVLQGMPIPRGQYSAAQIQRFVNFATTLESAHKERLRDRQKLVAHSRQLHKDNAYMKRFVELVSTHVVGPDGIQFESEIETEPGAPNEAWNDLVEQHFGEWCECCTADDRLSWIEFQQLAVETVAVDGEAIVRLVRGMGPYGLKLELIDSDRLDHSLNTPFRGGRRIVMGVEMDIWGRRIAYHLKTAHPSDTYGMPKRERVLADEILHLYVEDRAEGVRGVPWATPVMVQLNMLHRLWTSVLAAANAEADRIGIIKGSKDLLPGESSGLDPKGMAQEISSEMATFMGIDAGLDVVFPPLNHPSPSLEPFTRFLLKGTSAGLGVSYHSLAGDVSDANYSSARVALLDERDMWRKRQAWIIRKLHGPVFKAWLEMAWLKGRIALPVTDFKRICAPRWWPRSWDWVDPEKDADAALKSIAGALSTHQEELGARGRDWRETFRQLKAEQDYAEQIGLRINITPGKPPAPAKKEAPDAATA